MPCEQHEKIEIKINELEKEVARLNSEVKEGYKTIRSNRECVTSLKEKIAIQDERSNNIYKLLESLNSSIGGIDNKLDTYINDIRKEIKDLDRELKNTKEKLAVNDFKTNQNLEWNWKTLGVIGTIALILIQTLLDKFI